MRYNILNHELVPEHTLLSEKEKDEFLNKYKIQPDQLPKMLNTDPAVLATDGKPGQIVKIVRKSQTAKYATVYRFIVESDVEKKVRVAVPAAKVTIKNKD